MPRFDLVIFDNDGVLVDSEPIANRLLAEQLTSYGLPVDWHDCVERYLGSTLERVRTLVEAELGHSIPADFETRYREIVYPRLAVEVEAVPGVASVVDQLADRRRAYLRGLQWAARPHPTHLGPGRPARSLRRPRVQRRGRRGGQAGARSVPPRGGHVGRRAGALRGGGGTRRPGCRRPTPRV